MRENKVNKALERQILIGSIISGQFLKKLIQIYKPEYMQSSAAVTVVQWCMDYWKTYQRPPKQYIQDIFQSKARQGLDPDTAELIEELLGSISEEYEKADKFNADYLFDNTEKLFKQRNIELLTQDLSSSLSSGDVDTAEQLLVQFKSVQRFSSHAINPLTNQDSVYNAFENSTESLFTFPGALGKVINPQLLRESFIALMGPEKRGKSWWLMEFGMRAFKSRCNVVMFEVGDMSESQKMRRIYSYITRKPVGHYIKDHIYIPVLDCQYNQDNSCSLPDREIKFRLPETRDNPKVFADAMNKEGYGVCKACKNSKAFRGAIWYYKENVEPIMWRRAFKQGLQWHKRSRGKSLKLSVHENNTLSVHGIRMLLDTWEQTEGFVPDVIVIDYADILAPENKKEFRHQENEKWQAMRALSQNRHCCVITATQSDAASYDKENIGLSNFSEDKRKYSHVTAMYSLNQTDDERIQGIMRIGELLIREGEFDRRKKVRVLQCLQAGRPYIDSF